MFTHVIELKYGDKECSLEKTIDAPIPAVGTLINDAPGLVEFAKVEVVYMSVKGEYYVVSRGNPGTSGRLECYVQKLEAQDWKRIAWQNIKTPAPKVLAVTT